MSVVHSKTTRFISLASGSDGNCYYFEFQGKSLLIDAGIGGRTIKKRLTEFGIAIEEIDFILITHDHIDHIRHLGSLTERFKLPVYTSEKIHNSLAFHPCTAGKMAASRKVMEKERRYEICGIGVTAFEVPHDGSENLGYMIEAGEETLVLVTDAGRVTEKMVEYARKATRLVLESNYDDHMLKNGPYPQVLIDRIKNGHGHLSNSQTAAALKDIYNDRLKQLLLCHLSSNNNTPELAFKESSTSLSDLGVALGKDVELICLPRKESFLCFNLQ